ncbi:hypothetical protein E2C01_051554 [Portunus trituberculatus]|uniref:Uncharacterized protein n=1 Tax=Portunus trituberculatus TaxID=210409 RepID=A0A5B7GBX6_PORTR|nr:hypothetical protein [Portunus trituberculatus]
MYFNTIPASEHVSFQAFSNVSFQYTLQYHSSPISVLAPFIPVYAPVPFQLFSTHHSSHFSTLSFQPLSASIISGHFLIHTPLTFFSFLGTGSEVCGGGACCVPEVTNALLAAGKRSLRKVVSSTADKLLKELTTQRHRFSSK